jgi:AraC-like DNA-binding protein
MSPSTVSAGYLNALLDYAVARGADRDALVAAAAIDPAALKRLDQRLPLATLVELMAATKAATADPALAVKFGDEWDMAEASIAGLLGRSAETVVEAFGMMNSYGRLIVDVECTASDRFQLARDGERLVITDTRKSADAFPDLTEFTFARIAAVSRRMFGGDSYIRAVRFSHKAPAYRDIFEDIFKAPVAFGCPTNQLVADAAVLELKASLGQPRYAVTILGAHADDLLESLTRGSEIVERVEAVLAEGLPRRQVAKRAVAQQLGMSVQTLHRRLKAEGTTFEQVLRDVQMRRAKECLRSNLSVKQTAHMVGFAAATSFARAFKRWTGTSPGSLRS